MERRTPNEIAAEVVNDLMAAEGVTLKTLAQATDIGVSDLRDLLDSESEFTYDQIHRVGGFFRVPASTFFEDVAA